MKLTTMEGETCEANWLGHRDKLKLRGLAAENIMRSEHKMSDERVGTHKEKWVAQWTSPTK
jgi:hypothetical protein